MKKKTDTVSRGQLILFLIAVVMVVSGCVGVRQGESWAFTETIEFEEKSNLLVGYQNFVAMVDPVTGSAVPLVNPSTGEPRRDSDGNVRPWIVDGNQIEGAKFYSEPVRLDLESLLFPAFNNQFVNIDIVTAQPNATTPMPGQVLANMAMSDTLYYVPIITGEIVGEDEALIPVDGGIEAFDRETLSVVWTFKTDESVWAAPLLVDNVIYFGALDHKLYALDAETGNEIWSVDLGGGIASTPLYVDGHLYIGTFLGKVHDIDAETGDILAEADTVSWVWSTPVLDDNGLLYVTDMSGMVFAFDAQDGLTEVWSQSVSDRAIRPSPLVTDKYIIVASRNGHVYWLDRNNNGVIAYDKEIDGAPEVLSELVLLEPSELMDLREPIVVVPTTDFGKLLVAYTLDTAIPIWSYGR